MWRAIGTSVIGSAHEKLEIPCQDSCDYYSCLLGSERVLLIAISDGAGSAKASDLGSQETVKHLLSEIANSDLNPIEITEDVASNWILNARKHLQDLAEAKKLSVRDLDCTILFAILGESHSIFAQIGDGCWVAKTNDRYITATWPSNGQYANETTFITSPNWKNEMQFSILHEKLDAVAGFTDGLQNLALHFATKSVHSPFFESKFNALGLSDDETSLKAPLIAFLSSPALLERTDDDKSLVLAYRKETMLLAYPDC